MLAADGDRDPGVARLPPPCAHCGYERFGLDADRACPECGDVPDPDVRVFWGECLPRYLTTQFSWYWTIYIGGTALLLIAAWALRAAGVLPTTTGLEFWVLMAGLFVGVLAWQRLSRDERVAGSTQLRIGPDGWATRVGFGGVTWRKWPRRARVGASSPEKLIIETPQLGWIMIDRPLVFTFRDSADASEARRLVGAHYAEVA